MNSDQFRRFDPIKSHDMINNLMNQKYKFWDKKEYEIKKNWCNRIEPEFSWTCCPLR